MGIAVSGGVPALAFDPGGESNQGERSLGKYLGPFVDLDKLASSKYESEQAGYVVDGVYVQVHQLEEFCKMKQKLQLS